ncbi:MAG TPA: hypothetical protein VMH80_07855 [Bryobacteraceae bacterium]|nr:hypothetical protein [Bryobacteraceae bacterium]
MEISNDYTQERVHTARFFHLVDLYNAGEVRPLRAVMSGLEVPLEADQKVEGRFEWHKADFAFVAKSTEQTRIVVLEFKVDSLEGGFFKDDSQDTQTAKLTAAFQAERADVLDLIYVTLGNTEFAGPPRDERFKHVGLRQFANAVGAAAGICEVLRPWAAGLHQELNRRRMAPELAARRHLRPADETVAAAGYRGPGVQMGVYGALIEEWKRQGGESAFGPLRAYARGRRPDAILNFWKFLNQSAPWYLEINDNGTLNLKIEVQSMNDERWAALVFILQAVHDESRGPLVSKPERWEGRKTMTVCPWMIGLWEDSNRPALVVQRLLSLLNIYIPRLSQC